MLNSRRNKPGRSVRLATVGRARLATTGSVSGWSGTPGSNFAGASAPSAGLCGTSGGASAIANGLSGTEGADGSTSSVGASAKSFAAGASATTAGPTATSSSTVSAVANHVLSQLAQRTFRLAPSAVGAT